MDQALTNLGLTPDPNNPYYTPPGAAELGLRALGTALTPIAGQRSNTLTGTLLRSGLGFAGGLAGETGQAMAAKRLDPTTQAILAQRGAAQAMNQIQVGGQPSGSLAPFTPAPTDLSGATFTPVPSALPAFPAMAPSVPRRPESLPEALRNATPEQQAKLMAGVTIGKMQLPEMFEAPYYSHSKYPLIKVTGDQVREVYNPSLTADETLSDQAQNLHAKIALMRAKEPNNPLWRDIERSYMLSGTTNAEQRYALEIALNGGDALGALKNLNDVKATAAGQRSEQSQLGTIRAQGTPQAATSAGNVASGREKGAGAARIAVEQDKPLDVNANRWVNPQTLQYASPDLTPKAAKDNGFVPVTQNVSMAIPAARTALKTLDKYDELANKLLVPKGTGTASDIARIQYNRASLQARRSAGDPDVLEFDSLSSTLPTQVKAFGDTGNIAIKEQEFQARALPNTQDSRESALRKTATRRQLLREVIRSSLGSPTQRSQTNTLPPPPPLSGGQGSAAAPAVSYDDRWKEIQAELARRRKQ